MRLLTMGKYVPYHGNSCSADIRDRKDDTGSEESDSDDEDSNGMAPVPISMTAKRIRMG